ncbi:MAG: SDR family NAD(P)-dependent oxidoreductase [Leptospiraceae bacterium]|nr:SDR family NAD(P)-dependent oxidoreductase [Leptospiraceae bacterium]
MQAEDIAKHSNQPASGHHPRAIIIGATSGIGEHLYREFVRHGYRVGITGRRQERLTELQREQPDVTFIQSMDVRKVETACTELNQLILAMGGADLIVVNAGIGLRNPDLEWSLQADTIQTNVIGFCALCDAAVKYFRRQGYGYLVGISSVAGLRGLGKIPVYNATKAFDSIYLEGLRRMHRGRDVDLHVTDIRPGYVRTDLLNNPDKLPWVSQPEVAARQIYRAIQARKKVAYITRRWFLIAWLLRHAPDWLVDRLA